MFQINSNDVDGTELTVGRNSKYMQFRASYNPTGLIGSGEFVEQLCRLYFSGRAMLYTVCHLVLVTEPIICMPLYFPCLSSESG
jgi:hypothetical protein